MKSLRPAATIELATAAQRRLLDTAATVDDATRPADAIVDDLRVAVAEPEATWADAPDVAWAGAVLGAVVAG